MLEDFMHHYEETEKRSKGKTVVMVAVMELLE